jgi:primosomal protein N' (replication factor Y)
VIAKVEPLTPARALRGPFDYRLPGEMAGVGVGSMLIVPFGRRRLLGVVVDLAERSEVPPERLVEPLTALDQGVPPELVRLGLWVAEEYCSTPARGLALVLPPGAGTGALPKVGIRRALVARLTKAGAAALEAPERLGPRQRAALERLRAAPTTAAELARAAGCTHSTLRALEARGLIERRGDDHDRRVKMLTVTEKGADVRGTLLARLHEAPPEICALSRSDQRALRDLLRRALAARR